MSTADFYDALEPFYHLIYDDWPGSVDRQGDGLAAVFRQCWPAARTILDATCGIGTQAIGLAGLGFAVNASDISLGSVERLRREAANRGLHIAASVADVRRLHEHHRANFDIVLSCDNALPHLTPDDELPTALAQMFACTRPGGGCLISVRDYAQEKLEGRQLRPYGMRQMGDTTYVVLQTRECQADHYDVMLYVIEDDGRSPPRCHRMRDRYYPIAIDRLMALMAAAGFVDVRRIDGSYFQPLLLGLRPG